METELDVVEVTEVEEEAVVEDAVVKDVVSDAPESEAKTASEPLLTADERSALQALLDGGKLNDEDKARVQTLLLVDSGESRAKAITETGLSRGQVNYAIRKFETQRLAMFANSETAAPSTRGRKKGSSTKKTAAATKPAKSTPAKTEKPKGKPGRPRKEAVAVVTEAEATTEKVVVVESAPAPAPATSEDEPVVVISTSQFRALMAELNKFADRIQAQVKFTPPPFSADEMLHLMQKLTPERLTIISDMQTMLANRPDAKELLDAETWRGMWFIVSYTAQNESKSLLDKSVDTVMRLPGVSFGVRTSKAIFMKLPGSTLVMDILGMLEGASPKDLLDPETWRGMIYLINYSLQYELEQMKARLLGRTEEDEEGDEALDELAVE
jgi:hypothetical protein